MVTNFDLTKDPLFSLIARAKEEIQTDIANGIVPASVASFSELHDYVDANCYAGLCEEGMIKRLGGMDHTVDLANAMQDVIDAWLKDGRRS